MSSIEMFWQNLVVVHVFWWRIFYSGPFCLYPSHCRNAFGELLQTRVFSKEDWVGKISSEVRSMSDVCVRCNGCLKLGDDFFFTLKNRVFWPFCALFCQISRVLTLHWLGGDAPTPSEVSPWFKNDCRYRRETYGTLYSKNLTYTKFQRNLSDLF